MTTGGNPYEAPRQAPLDVARRGVTRIPRPLADHTRKVVNRFGLFQVAWPILVAYWTDSFVFDIWALFIATNGLRVTPISFRRFPWTAVMCGLYPVAFILSMVRHDPRDLWNWIPARFLPVLLLQLVSAGWALYCIYCILRCHFAHQRTPC